MNSTPPTIESRVLESVIDEDGDAYTTPTEVMRGIADAAQAPLAVVKRSPAMQEAAQQVFYLNDNATALARMAAIANAIGELSRSQRSSTAVINKTVEPLARAIVQTAALATSNHAQLQSMSLDVARLQGQVDALQVLATRSEAPVSVTVNNRNGHQSASTMSDRGLRWCGHSYDERGRPVSTYEAPNLSTGQIDRFEFDRSHLRQGPGGKTREFSFFNLLAISLLGAAILTLMTPSD